MQYARQFWCWSIRGIDDLYTFCTSVPYPYKLESRDSQIEKYVPIREHSSFWLKLRLSGEL
jgi:hypothetical protein